MVKKHLNILAWNTTGGRISLCPLFSPWGGSVCVLCSLRGKDQSVSSVLSVGRISLCPLFSPWEGSVCVLCSLRGSGSEMVTFIHIYIYSLFMNQVPLANVVSPTRYLFSPVGLLCNCVCHLNGFYAPGNSCPHCHTSLLYSAHSHNPCTASDSYAAPYIVPLQGGWVRRFSDLVYRTSKHFAITGANLPSAHGSSYASLHT